LEEHRAAVWLVNTGWTGGPYGVGRRMTLAYTRALLRAALAGELAAARFSPDPVFGLLVPEACPGVPAEVLRPRATWPDPAAYDAAARRLAQLFRDNFARFTAAAPDGVRRAGPIG
jgi:phosphoenolpyruvate carboxykinase (ATP)